MIERFGRWLVQRLMHAESLGILLIVLALFTFCSGISASLRNTETGSFLGICLAAAAIGFMLEKLHWNGIQATAGIVALGVLFIWSMGARLTQPLLDLLTEALSMLPQVIPAIRSNASVDTTRLLEAWTVIAQSSSALVVRFQTWMIGFDKNITINDALIRNMVWALTLWLCSAWMGWFAGKRNAVVAFLPAMALLSIVASYSEYRIESLWVMLILLLFLMGIWNYRNHTLQWLNRRIDYSDSIRLDNTQAVIFLTLAIGTFAFITPSISWRDIMDYIRERQEKNETAEMLGVQPPYSSGKPVYIQQPALPRDHLLNSASANSEKIVMTIRTGELPPVPEELLPAAVPRYYWRSTVYDRYVGTGWVTSTIFPQSISADTPLIPGLLNGYRLVHMDVKMDEPEGRLFWSGILFSVDSPFTANWRLRPPSDLFADQQALLLADMFAASTAMDNYQAETYVPIPTLNDLRSASTNYPEDIRVRYLPLPLALPERVRELAYDITRGQANPYDKAKAIESYLRTNYPYTLDVPAPPEGRDVAEYFLFDLKQGYCDYYATAMVVLARASGLPARFVSGYSPGSYDAPNAQYIIRERNAHSWAEVYFPEIGWVEFEPTASQPEILRTEVSIPILPDQDNEETATQMLARFRLERILLWSSPVLALLAGVLLYYMFIERWLVLRLAPQAAMDNIYQRFYRAGRPLAGAWIHAETSSEFLLKFLFTCDKLQIRRRYKKLSTEIRSNAMELTNLYHTSLFVDHQTNKHEAVSAWRLWKRLRRQLFYIKLLLRFTNMYYLLDSNRS